MKFLNERNSFLPTSCTFRAQSTGLTFRTRGTSRTLGPDAPIATCVIVTAAAAWSTIFLLGFTGLTEATAASDDHFSLAFPRDVEAFAHSPFFFLDALGCLTGAFPAASSFLFFEASVKASEPGTKRGL
jgi:hypothetical protein